MPAERFAATQLRKARVLCKSAYADDGVMAPISALSAVPPGDPGSDLRPVKPSGELLQSRKQCSCVDHDRERLDKGDAGMPLHGCGQTRDGIARPQAVGLEDDHVVVGGSEPPDPVLDIAGLFRRVLAPVPVKHIAGA